MWLYYSVTVTDQKWKFHSVATKVKLVKQMLMQKERGFIQMQGDLGKWRTPNSKPISSFRRKSPSALSKAQTKASVWVYSFILKYSPLETAGVCYAALVPFRYLSLSPSTVHFRILPGACMWSPHGRGLCGCQGYMAVCSWAKEHLRAWASESPGRWEQCSRLEAMGHMAAKAMLPMNSTCE